MNYYTTEAAKILAEKPINTVNMTANEIVNYAICHYKMAGREPQNKFTVYMRAVNDAIFNPEDWKAPIYAILPDCGKEWAKAAIIWFHGQVPIESFSGVYSNGYAAS